jgi:lipopolysaccharide export system permease protein
MSLACFLFFFIGAPLGTIIRKGGIGIPLVITVVFFAFYFVLSIFGEKMAKNGDTSVWFGMWLSTIITLPICIFLTYKATMDSAMLSPDAYANFFRKVKCFFSKKSRKSLS